MDNRLPSGNQTFTEAIWAAPALSAVFRTQPLRRRRRRVMGVELREIGAVEGVQHRRMRARASLRPGWRWKSEIL